MTLVVRLFVADDLDGFEGTIQRPGDEAIVFHDAADLIRQLTAMLQARGPGGAEGDNDPGWPSSSPRPTTESPGS
jgi:hypothetical protein